MFTHDCLIEISENVARLLGLHYPENRLKDLERLILKAAKELSLGEDICSINDWLKAPHIPAPQLLVLSEQLRVGETYFFREETALKLFREVILPQIIELRKGKEKYIRIWSAGCSSGEEPYTLAMLLLESLPEINDWEISILATDISLAALNKAIQGKYTSWSFRQTDQSIKDKYFTSNGKEWEVLPILKKMVTFERLNLVDDIYNLASSGPNCMDAIFCRNVLMYFTPEKARAAGHRFFYSLAENGWLITSQVELSEDYFSDFRRINFSNGIFYQKSPKLPSQGPSCFFDIKIEEEEPKLIRKTNPVIIEKLKSHSSVLVEKHKELIALADPDVLFKKGLYAQCADQCLKTIQKAPDESKNILLLVKCYANMGQLENARLWCKQLILTNNLTSESYHFIATVFLESNDLISAETVLRKALYLNQTNVSALITLGNVLKRQGKKQSGIRSFENAQEILDAMDLDDLVPGFDGLTAGRIKEMVEMSIKT
ncbi:MAG: CheR family methyltransferase [Bacteroidales bacterium]